MQDLLVLQSLWAMERYHTDGIEYALEEKVERIVEAGYDGISMSFAEATKVRRVASLLKGTGLVFEAQYYPRDAEGLKAGLELGSEIGVHHLAVQADIRPRRLADCVAVLDNWRRLAEQVDFPILIETHRGQMTNDLLVILDLLDCFPDLKLLGDLSHIVVSREFALPLSAENEAMMRRVLDNCWAFHGRVASSQQVQVELLFRHNKPWLDLFMGWWDCGFRSWRRRAGPSETLSFTCELGPKPYAPAGVDGNDLSDRWSEALLLKEAVKQTWANSGSDRPHQ